MKIPRYLKKALIVTAGILLVGALFFSFVIIPARIRLDGLYAQIGVTQESLNNMEQRLNQSARQRQLTAEAEAARRSMMEQGVIEPLLGSYAMRGKLLLDPVAHASGFNIMDTRELHVVPLQLPKEAPKQLYARQLIEFSGTGAYTQIVALIKLAEERLPFATLAGLKIEANRQNPEAHTAAITFEWPVKWRSPSP